MELQWQPFNWRYKYILREINNIKKRVSAFLLPVFQYICGTAKSEYSPVTGN